MKLIVILICLGLERYVGIGAWLKRFTWCDFYISKMGDIFQNIKLPSPWLKLLVYVLPLWVIVGLVLFALGDFVYGLFALLIHVGVLCACLGPDDLYHQVSSYFAATEKEGGQAEAKEYLNAILEDKVPSDPNEASRALTSSILVQANERFFAVIFCYILPFGLMLALLYRLVAMLHQKAAKNEKYASLEPAASMVHNILDWIPARLCSLGYALVGNFTKTFRYCLSQVIVAGLSESRNFLMKAGHLALGLTDSVKKADQAENREALDMVDRVLVIFLVAIAVFTLGAWIS